MNRNKKSASAEAWKNFIASGMIADYLVYKNPAYANSAAEEAKNAAYGQRIGDKGKSGRRV